MQAAQNDQIIEEFRIIFMGGVIANGILGILFLFFQSDEKYYYSNNTCVQLKYSSYIAGIFCLISSIAILQLILLTACLARTGSFKIFKAMIYINGIFPFIYGILQFIIILWVGQTYNLNENCGSLRSLVTVYIIVGYSILTFVLLSFCSLFTCYIIGQDAGIWPTYLYMRAKELEEEIDYEEAISSTNFQQA